MKKTATTTFKILIEIALGFFLIICLACGLLAWKLSQGPINLDRLTPYFIDYFNDTNEETIQMDSLVLKWDGLENPLSFTATNVVVSNNRGPFLYSPEIDLSLNTAPLLIGQLDIETVWIKQIVLSVTKQEDGDFTITGQPFTEDREDNLPDITPAKLTLNDVIHDLPDLDYFWIDEARIIYRDEAYDKTQVFEPVTLYAETKKKQRALSGFLSFPFGNDLNSNIVQMNFETSSDPLFLNIFGAFEQTPIGNFLQFAPPLPEGLDIDMVVDAEIGLQLDNNWNLHGMDATVDAAEGRVAYPVNEETKEIDFTNLNMHLVLNPKNDVMTIHNASLLLNGEVPLSMSGHLKAINNPKELSGDVVTEVTNLPQQYFKRYWPQNYSDNGVHRWLTDKIKGGVFPSVSFDLGFDLKNEQRTDELPLPTWIDHVNADFTYEGLTIDYNSPMAAAQNVKGSGAYKNVELDLNIEEAVIGGMNVADGSLYFDDLISRGEGKAEMNFPVTAQAQEVFDYIAAKPIQAFKNTDFNPQNTKGDVRATVKINMPLLKDLPMEKIEVKVDGTVNNADIPDAVRGLTLSGGPYDIAATTQDIKVKGSGRLAGEPITLDWHEHYSSTNPDDYRSKINATLSANDKIRRAFIDNYADHFNGPTQIKLNYLKPKGGNSTNIDLQLDLTDTSLNLNEIGLNKSSGDKVNATMSVGLQNGDLSEINKIKINGDALSLENGSMRFKSENGKPAITKGVLDDLRFNNNNLSLVAAQEGNLLKTNITGKYLNIVPLLEGEKRDIENAKDETKTTSRPVEIGIAVDEMQTAEKSSIKRPKIYAKLNGDARIERFELDAYLGDKTNEGQLYIRYTPDVADGLSLRVETNNAGELLRSFNLYPYIRGGKLQIAGRPVKGGRFGDVEGKARIDDFAVMDAPVMLRLMNALSFQNFLQGGAIRFSRLESDFEWRLGDRGHTYNIMNGRTSGAAVALTFDGYINNAENDMRINGTAAPLSSLNSMIGNIPIVGQILTGGDALLAATYTVSGNPDDPSVSVNPLSVLAPGIIRKMLFESNPTPDSKRETPQERSVN